MAKRKTPKAEKVIDLTPKPEKITEQQLAKLQSNIKTIDKLTVDVGRMEVSKWGLVRAMQNVQENVEDIRVEFMNEYGTDDINIQTGEIAYKPENPNPPENGETDKKD